MREGQAPSTPNESERITMAIYHCCIKTGSRGKGQSAIAASAYRAGTKLTDEQTGEISDYTHKSGVIYSEICLCENAPIAYSDRQTLWNAVQEIEKASNSRLFREIEVALPREMKRADHIRTVQEYVKHFTDNGMCADWSLHDKGTGNPHAHIMLTVRGIDENGKWTPKSRKVYDLDENGQRILQKIDKTGRKQYKSHKEDYNNWNDKERVTEWRELWAKCCNARLSEREQIDHRSHTERGLKTLPTIHEGYAARKLAAGGKHSDRIQLNADIKAYNKEYRHLEERIKVFNEQLKARITKEKKVMGNTKFSIILSKKNNAIIGLDQEKEKICLFINKELKATCNASDFELQKTEKGIEVKAINTLFHDRYYDSLLRFERLVKISLEAKKADFDELIQQARETNLLEYFRKNGYTTEKYGNQYYIKEFPSLCIKPDNNQWYYGYDNTGRINNSIDCLTLVLKRSFNQAVYELTGNDINRSRDDERAGVAEQPLFSKEKIMSDKFKPVSEQQEEVTQHISRGRRR